MAANETRITRLTRAIGGVTTIFRCHGLSMISPTADRIGGHDLVYWAGFLLAISAWFLLGYMPQCRRFEKLSGRQQALILTLESEKKELGRLRQGIASLQKGDALAWERATRKRLGWLEPGEVLDVGTYLKSRGALASAGMNSSGGRSPSRQASPAPVLPRPRVPQIPHPQQSVPSGFTNIRAPILPFADSGALGPVAPLPPPAPHVPVLPQRPGAPYVQRASVVRPGARLRSN